MDALDGGIGRAHPPRARCRLRSGPALHRGIDRNGRDCRRRAAALAGGRGAHRPRRGAAAARLGGHSMRAPLRRGLPTCCRSSRIGGTDEPRGPFDGDAAARRPPGCLPIIFAVTFHEAAHGFVAYRFGDDTAARAGRMSLQPAEPHRSVRHGAAAGRCSMSVRGFLFGYAKPVPVNFGRLQHPRRDMVLVALAGPMTNVLLAIVSGAACLCDRSVAARHGRRWAIGKPQHSL